MTAAEVRRARTAVMTVFALTGLAVATWMSRIPAVRDQLDLTPGQLGRVMLAMAAGAVLALPTAGLVVGRLGAASTVRFGAVACGAGLLAAGAGVSVVGDPLLVAAGLFVFGYGCGIWDVAMNVEGAEVERRLGRTLMPRLHAGFSIGTVAGAGLGAAAAATDLAVGVHLALVGVATAAVPVVVARFFLAKAPATPATPAAPAVSQSAAAAPAAARAAADPPDAPRPSLLATWQEPRTLLIGVLVLTFALAEGVANEWLAVGLVDGLGVANAVGALGFAVFVSAMTVARLFGSALLDRYGRVPVLRASTGLIAAGVLLVVFGSLPVAMVGAVAWGLGAALGFPVGMSAAADEPVRAPLRVSVVASVAYTAFLAGPPLLGWLGDHFGVQRALLVVLAAAMIGALVAGATRPLRESSHSRRSAVCDPLDVRMT